MVRLGGGFITKSRTLLLRSCREAKRGKSEISKISREVEGGAESNGVSKGSEKKREEGTCWVPHPRTGIYFPKGHEWVMKDVPEGAASFTYTCWFRNDDGLDYPNP